MTAVPVLAFIVVRAPLGSFFRFGYISKPTVWPGAPRGPETQLISDLSSRHKEYFAESVRLAGIEKL